MIEQIRQMGELSVPNYWKQALTDDRFGYYRQQNVFSKDGDFITAPEISTLFGEMVATWITVFLQSPKVNAVNPFTNNVDKPFRLV
jgi:SAM-dependent MidA family methyltransferase